MRVLIATPLYPPEAGGPATYAKLLCEEFPKHGVEAVLVKWSDTLGYPKFFRHLVYAWRVFRAARAADAILALDPVSVGLPACLASVLSGKPFFLRIAGDYAWEQGTQRFGVKELLDEFSVRRDYPFSVRALRAVETFVAKRARRVIVPSAYLKRIVSLWGVRPDSISVVYNAAPSISEESPRPPHAPENYIAVVARLVPWKGIEAVIRAVATLRTHADVGLIVVGDGPERSPLEAAARASGVAEAILFTGSLPHETTLAYLAHAKALVLNTGYEGLSHLILEAFRLRVPVITTAVGGNPELVTDEMTGLIIPFNDVPALASAITRLLSDEKLRRHIVHEAEKRVESFTREATVTGSLAALQL